MKKSALIVMLIVMCIFSLAVNISFIIAANYYVSSSIGVDDIAHGITPEIPLKTLSYTIKNVKSGDSILLKKGDIWREQLDVTLNNLTINCYGDGNSKALISGGEEVVGSIWTYLGNNLWQAILTNEVKNVIFRKNGDNNYVLGQMITTPVTDYQWYSQSGTGYLIIYSPASLKPSEYYDSIEAAQRDFCVRANVNDFKISNVIGRNVNNDIFTSSIGTGHIYQNCEGHYANSTTAANAFTGHNVFSATYNNCVANFTATGFGFGGSGPVNIKLNDCTITNSSMSGYSSGTNGNHTLNRCSFYDNRYAIIPNNGIVSINSCIISGYGNFPAPSYGISITNVGANVTVRNSIIYGWNAYCIYFSNGHLGLHNTILHNNSKAVFYKGLSASYNGDLNDFWRDTDGTMINYNGINYTKAQFNLYKNSASPNDQNSSCQDPQSWH
jgi:hypothetical protein